jgi:hypothetical protein
MFSLPFQMTKNQLEIPKPILSMTQLDEGVIAVVQQHLITLIKADYAKLSVT